METKAVAEQGGPSVTSCFVAAKRRRNRRQGIISVPSCPERFMVFENLAPTGDRTQLLTK